MRKIVCAVVVAFSVAGSVQVGGVHADDGSQSSVADYNGNEIDTAISWEGAQACWISQTGNRCFDTEVEMDAAIAASGIGRGDASILSTCSSTLRLYDGTSFTGTVLALSLEGSWIQLSANNFSAKTSSYIIGACNSSFKDASSVYPGTTTAGASASTMASGWDNRVTQVFIS